MTNWFLILVVLLSVSACKTQEKPQKTETSAEESKSSNTGNVNLSTPADGALVQATIMEVLKLDPIAHSTGICSAYPCNAMVRIDTVLLRGREAGHSLENGKVVKVHFGYSLSPTDHSMFPNLNKHYPGLKKEDQFEAPIRVSLGLQNNLDYRVFHYKQLQQENE